MPDIPYQALLVVSFGGPESRDDVLPFLENVLRGRHVPRKRMLEVADHYDHFGGRSPLNQQNRELIAALQVELERRGPLLPIYWGNRNWHPFLADTLRQMAADGIGRALAYVTSAYSSYSGCRQYRENIAAAQATLGSNAPQVDKLRVFFNHPGFIRPMVERVGAALGELPLELRDEAPLLFTAHSIPQTMAAGCDYERQLREAASLVAEGANRGVWQLVFQSRSGAPSQPWLEPDIGDALRALTTKAHRAAVVVPIGFLSDHMEVLYDLDVEARSLSSALGLRYVRAATVGNDPRFVAMIAELIRERCNPELPRRALGSLGPWHDVCPESCCPAPVGGHAVIR